MIAPPTNRAQKGIQLLYTNPYSGERLADQSTDYSFSNVSRLLSHFTNPRVSLITTMPSGLGLDFHSEDDGTIWIEFYGDVLQSTFVDLEKAQNILERAYNLKSHLPVRDVFSDLVQKWEY